MRSCGLISFTSGRRRVEIGGEIFRFWYSSKLGFLFGVVVRFVGLRDARVFLAC